jgi:putative endonuclease
LGRENKEIGKIGEQIAMTFLEQKGYEVLDTNVRTPFGEIDIVARRKEMTVFVEVKTRATSSLGPPFLNVTREKQRHLIRNALCYLKRRGRVYSDWRIDIVSVKLNDRREPESIELIENAVEEY